MELFELSPFILAAIPVIVGLVSVVKNLTGFNPKYSPLVSMAIGIGIASLTSIAWQAMIVQGIIAGLMSSGIYSGAKSLIKK